MEYPIAGACEKELRGYRADRIILTDSISSQVADSFDYLFVQLTFLFCASLLLVLLGCGATSFFW